ncbi:hypothetical protein EAH79_16210 [Sphingomonas koreensis]|nr:hypothetical protein EAH79_16210 [Sphingomonas koreensis]
MPFTHQKTPRGDLFGANGRNVHIPAGNDTLAAAIEPLMRFTQAATDAADLIQPDKLPDQLRSRFGGLLFDASSNAIEMARVARRDTMEADARSMQVPASINMSNAAEIRSIYRSLDAGEQHRRVLNAPLVELAALVEPGTGNLAALPDVTLNAAVERYAVAAHAERSGMAGSFPRQPSLDGEISAIGVDENATLAAAEAVMAKHRDRLAQISKNEAVLRDLIGYVAAALDIAPQDALAQSLAA